jgi:hypothetical protein
MTDATAEIAEQIAELNVQIAALNVGIDMDRGRIALYETELSKTDVTEERIYYKRLIFSTVDTLNETTKAVKELSETVKELSKTRNFYLGKLIDCHPCHPRVIYFNFFASFGSKGIGKNVTARETESTTVSTEISILGNFFEHSAISQRTASELTGLSTSEGAGAEGSKECTEDVSVGSLGSGKEAEGKAFHDVDSELSEISESSESSGSSESCGQHSTQFRMSGDKT